MRISATGGGGNSVHQSDCTVITLCLLNYLTATYQRSLHQHHCENSKFRRQEEGKGPFLKMSFRSRQKSACVSSFFHRFTFLSSPLYFCASLLQGFKINIYIFFSFYSFVQGKTNEINRCNKMPSLDIAPLQIILNPRSCICKNISLIHPGCPSGFFPSSTNYSFVRMLVPIVQGGAETIRRLIT